MSDFETNLKILLEQYPFIEAENLNECGSEVVLEKDSTGKTIFGYRKNDHIYYFNSRYDSKQIAMRWAEKFDASNPYSIFIIYGLSNGDYVRELSKRCPDNYIIVYDPSTDMLRAFLALEDADEIIMNSKICLAVGDNALRILLEYFGDLIYYSNFRLVQWGFTPNYKNIWPNELIESEKKFIDSYEMRIMTRNTQILGENLIKDNFLLNLKDCIKQYPVYELVKTVKNSELRKFPAIVVSAGPSLSKNIKELRNAKGRAFIIAVDAALPALHKEGIIPDLAVTVDPKKPMELFQFEEFERIPLIVDISHNPKINPLSHAKHFYMNSEEKYVDAIYDKYHKPIGKLESGGSVACIAFSFCEKSGFENIILIGQDLAYPNNKQHAENTYSDKRFIELDSEKEYFEVEDINGDMVLTEVNMNYYRKWFEQQIIRYPKLHVIDATEGGAKIHGSEIKPLKEVIESLCDEKTIDFAQIADQVETTFSPSEQDEILESFQNLGKQMDSFKRKLTKGIRAYETMDRLKKQGRTTDKEFKKAYADVTKINDWATKSTELRLLDMYGNFVDYMIQDEILMVKNDIDEEWDKTIELGTTYLKNYKNSADRFKKDLHLLLD